MSSTKLSYRTIVTIVTTEEPFAEAEDTETSKGTPQIAAISVTPVSAYDCR